MEWVVLDTGINSAEENMSIDADLLARAETLTAPHLHLYEWKRKSITYGHFIKPEKFLQLKAVEELGWEIAKRPTGGGIVLHPFDMAFSVMVPATCSLFSANTLQNYAFVNQAVLLACQKFLEMRSLSLIPQDAPCTDSHSSHFCMTRPTKYDVVLHGKKIAGASQRKTRNGFLHQGMIALTLPNEDLLRSIVQPGTDVVESMLRTTSPLLLPGHTARDLTQAKVVLKDLLSMHLTELSLHSTFGVNRP